MKSQSLSITGRSFYKFRALMGASLEKAVEKMLAAGVSEGTVSGQISIRLDRSVNDETGEVTIRPRFVFNTTLSVPVKISEKDETNEDLVLFRDEKSGRLKVCENQVTMDDILANSEIVPDADPEAELAKQLAEAIMDADDEDPEEEEPVEDDQEEEDGDHGEREEPSGET